MSLSRVALALSVTCTAALLVLPPATPNDTTLPVLLGALASLAVFVVEEHRRPRTGVRLLLGAGAALTVVAVVFPPHASHDVWSYAMYGRILGIHHANPYVLPPAVFTSDPFLNRLAHAWRGTPSVYGPTFTLVSALLARLAGPSPLVARLSFQVLAAVSFLGVGAILVRGRAAPAMVAIVVVNPLFLVTVVNGAHNDMLVALGVLVAARAVGRGRPLLGGVLVALAATVKVAALLAAVALALWCWRQHRRREATTLVVAAVVPTLAATVVFGLRAGWAPLAAASGHFNGPTLWRFVVTGVAGPGHPLPGSLGRLAEAVALALAVTACLIVTRGGRSPATAVAATLAAYLLAAPYIMPWYLAWALPVAVAAGQYPVVGLLGVDAAVLLIAAQYITVARPDRLDQLLRGFLVSAEAFALVASLVLIVVIARRGNLPAPAETILG